MHVTAVRLARQPRLPFVADVVSWGYAPVAVFAILAWDLAPSTAQAVAIAVIFLLLRAVSREIGRAARTA